MKTYRPTREVLSSIETLLSTNRPSFHHSPLEDVAELLTSGRHYSWVGIYLTLNKKSTAPLQQTGVHPAQVALPGTVKKIVVSIKIAGRELGFLNVESDRSASFGANDRVLLERVASLLARFLTGTGKYLVRRAGYSAPAQRAASA